MATHLLRYDTARRAIAAACRVDEVKSIRDRAEAVRTYAKQAGDFGLQNQAATIQIMAEHRVGQLLVAMAKHPGDRGKGRPRRNGKRQSSASTADCSGAIPEFLCLAS